ncbi:VOC family protein [Mesonia ostreae]|uniref:VOC family protein n=1 Tax=Mesonia ostreae TaxID=861110 RepID=A0ABU2KG97_9FLAO|nr:VOC family protein [Mesonia ostreae]MDT0293730.1 VOC family protein [Mesonia ostreae]
MSYPVNFSHVGISVPDIEKAMQFYIKALGFYHIAGPIEVNENEDNHLSFISKKIYGQGWKKFKFAHLSSADGIGLEIFEFANNSEKKSDNSSFKTSVFHFCVQHPNIEEMIERIVSHGGKETMPPQEMYPGKKLYKMAFTEDPFGNSIEIYTHAYELQNVGNNGSIT